MVEPHWRAGLVLALMLLIPGGCGTSSPWRQEPGDGRGEPGDSRDVCVPGTRCCPGAALGCDPERRNLLVCGEDGEEVLQPCLDLQGEPTLCIPARDEAPAYCGTCVPGRNVCSEDQRVMMCAQDGVSLTEKEDCAPLETGRVCTQGACISLCELNYKLEMYMGCEFWAVDLDNIAFWDGPSGFLDAAGSQYSVVVSNPSPYPARVKIETAEQEVTLDSSGQPLPSQPLAPGDLRIYNLPRRDVDGTTISSLAYRVSSSVPITAYQFNPLQNVDVFSNDASLLLPSNVAGRYYLVMTREQSHADLRAFLTVVAIKPGETRVALDLTAETMPGYDHRRSREISHFDAGDSATFVLEQFDVLNIETNRLGEDLTGSLILSDKEVVVFGGAESANAPNTNHCLVQEGVCEWDLETPCSTNQDCTDAGFVTCCLDHLEQQLFPVKSWGKTYHGAKSFRRNQEKDLFRVIAAQDGTMVTTLPVQSQIPLLNRGEWVEFESDQDFEIAANKPVMVGQFLAAEHAPGPGKDEPGDAGIGDPAFILLVPDEQFRSDYVVLAPDKYALDYVTVIAAGGARVYFDCVPGDDACESIPEDQFSWYLGQTHKVARFQVGDGVHRISSDQPVGVYVYGFDERVSYGYPGGLDIRDLGLINEPGEL